MSVLIDENTKVIVQGITGRDGSFHASKMKEYGTKVVGGVTPGKGGQHIHDIPVFGTMREAVAETQANTSVIYVPYFVAADAILEAVDAGIELVVAITEGIPANDMLFIYHYMQGKPCRLIGPNCPGLLSPGKSKVGILPAQITKPGPVGVVSRSGTLTYEVVNALSEKGIGQTTCVGIGGDPIIGTNFIDMLRLFQDDPDTKGIALIGEIGGSAEEEAAAFIQACVTKPVVGFISGRSAPKGKRMGHAGAIISGNTGTAEAKVEAFNNAKVKIADTPVQIADLMADVL